MERQHSPEAALNGRYFYIVTFLPRFTWLLLTAVLLLTLCFWFGFRGVFMPLGFVIRFFVYHTFVVVLVSEIEIPNVRSLSMWLIQTISS